MLHSLHNCRGGAAMTTTFTQAYGRDDAGLPVMTQRPPVGARVGAIRNADLNAVQLYGYGVYDGEQIAPFGPLGCTAEQYRRITGRPMPLVKDHRITLDDGRVVWGIECWWAPEDRVRSEIGNRLVIAI